MIDSLFRIGGRMVQMKFLKDNLDPFFSSPLELVSAVRSGWIWIRVSRRRDDSSFCQITVEHRVAWRCCNNKVILIIDIDRMISYWRFNKDFQRLNGAYRSTVKAGVRNLPNFLFVSHPAESCDALIEYRMFQLRSLVPHIQPIPVALSSV